MARRQRRQRSCQPHPATIRRVALHPSSPPQADTRARLAASKRGPSGTHNRHNQQHPPRRQRARCPSGQTPPRPPPPPRPRWLPAAPAGCRACIGTACGRGLWRCAQPPSLRLLRRRLPPPAAMAPPLAAPLPRSWPGGAEPAAERAAGGRTRCRRAPLHPAASSAAAAAARRPQCGCLPPGTEPGTHRRLWTRLRRCHPQSPADAGRGGGG